MAEAALWVGVGLVYLGLGVAANQTVLRPRNGANPSDALRGVVVLLWLPLAAGGALLFGFWYGLLVPARWLLALLGALRWRASN